MAFREWGWLGAAAGAAVIGLLGLSPVRAGAPPPETLALEQLAVDSRCRTPRSEPALYWVTAGKELASWGSRLGAPTAGAEHTDPPWTVDFTRYRVLVVDMGPRPTAGYGVALRRSNGRIQGSILRVPIRWREPPASGVVAQVRTHPCLLIRIPKGGYNRVEVIDQAGRPRGKRAIQAPGPDPANR